MSSTRKKISIYDYPEHLNPFSELKPTVPSEKTGRAFVNRVNMSGTWSSKISKRVNRSVTWIEKSWLGIEDSKKYRIQPGKIGGSTENNHDNTPKNVSESCNSANPNEESHYDYQQVRERIRETIVNPNEMNISSTKPEEEGKEIKKRKKRPAPQPPSATRDTKATSIENLASKSNENAKSDEKNEEMENSSADTCMKQRSVSHTSAEESEKEHSDVNDRTCSGSPSIDESTLSPCESEKDLDVHPDSSVNRLEECTVLASRPNRLPKNKVDVGEKLSPPPPNTDKDARRTSTERSNSRDSDDNDQIFVDESTEVVPDECKSNENGNVQHCENEVEENISAEIDKQCNGKAIQV